jgi:hypothetical protein
MHFNKLVNIIIDLITRYHGTGFDSKQELILRDVHRYLKDYNSNYLRIALDLDNSTTDKIKFAGTTYILPTDDNSCNRLDIDFVIECTPSFWLPIDITDFTQDIRALIIEGGPITDILSEDDIADYQLSLSREMDNIIECLYAAFEDYHQC